MDKSAELRQSLSLSHWAVLLTAILLVVVPWWLGIMWLIGALS